MHNLQEPQYTQQRQPLSAAKHFWLSFLAVVTGLPVAWMIVSIGFTLLTVVFVIAMAVAGGSAGSSTQNGMYVYGDKASTHVIASVPINGVILSGSAADPLQTIFGQSYTDGEHVKEVLRKLADENTASGVILEVDSPGGMVTASKAIADGIAYYKDKTHKPIIAHINGEGASGAYWASAATDAIYAEQGSEAGSIGVIMGPLVTMKGITSYNGVSTNEPMKFQYFSAGTSKDLGNPYRDMTSAEETFITKQIQAEYEKFVAHVSEHRKISADTIKNEIGAFPYGTDEAIRLKLIDGEKSKEQTYDEAGRLAGVGSNFQIQKVSLNSGFWSSVFGVHSIWQGLRMSSSEKSAARTRFCQTSLLGKPMVYEGDVSSICK